MVVAITRSADATAVRAAGATPKVVARGNAQLGKVGSAMKSAHVAGTSWGVDPVANQVLISADSTVTDVLPAGDRTAGRVRVSVF
jgi:hypothetical protein